MAHKNVEIEIQVNVENSSGLIEFLKRKGVWQGEKHQIDEYFSPQWRDFLSVRPVIEWLRLRDASGHYSINYKKWRPNAKGETHHCDEFETKIDNLDMVKKILRALDLKTIAVVDKIRKVWNYQNYEIAVDSVKNLGNFVEVEYIGTDENINPEKVTEEMIRFLKKSGCGKISRNFQGYPFLILFPKEAKYEIQ